MKKYKTIEERLFDIEFALRIIFFGLIVFAGSIFNMLVISFNDGKMPVYTMNPVSSQKHFQFTDFNQVLYPYFSDIINIKGIIFSIGDIIIYLSFLGMFITIILHIYSKRKLKKRIRKEFIEVELGLIPLPRKTFG